MASKKIKLPADVAIKDRGKGEAIKSSPSKIINPNDVEESRLAKMLAPIMKIHPNETAFPMNPDRFIAISRFRTHRTGPKLGPISTPKKDQGFNKVTNKWKTTNSKADKYFNIPISIINRYGLHGKNKNRRPRDKNNGKGARLVFLDPKKKFINGDKNPNGRIPAYYYYRKEKLGPTRRTRILITYWVFFGNNPTPPIAHQGDWTRVTVLVNPTSVSVDGIWFSRHGVGPFFHNDSELFFDRGRPVVYISKKSHGTFVSPGIHKFEQVSGFSDFLAKSMKKIGFADTTANGGIAWNISRKLLPLKDQPWRNYAGAWGEVGEFRETTGPLSPWHKRQRK